MKKELLQQLELMEQLAKGSKMKRIRYDPLKYILAQGYRFIIHRFWKNGLRLKTTTFWKERFMVDLPAGTDIFLTGGKSDDSEIRLARYMIRTLQPGDCVLDIGSHFGYYSRLALHCTGKEGKLIALEPSRKTFEVLQLNLKEHPNAHCIQSMAGGDTASKIFYSFPLIFSEYNTAHPEQFNKTNWYHNQQTESYPVNCTTIDDLVFTNSHYPAFIKIDTEGSELEVIIGAKQTLANFPKLVVAMEFLSSVRSNKSHQKAAEILRENKFQSYIIDAEGNLLPCVDLDTHFREKNIDSDNIIFKI